MAPKLPEAGMVALCVAGCAAILKPLLSFLEGAPARGPVLELDAAVLFVTLILPMACLAGVILLNPHVTTAGGAPVVLAALRRYALLVCTLLVLLSVVSLFSDAGVRLDPNVHPPAAVVRALNSKFCRYRASRKNRAPYSKHSAS